MLSRVERLLRVVAAGLVVGLVVLVGAGILLRPTVPIHSPTVAGRVLVRQVGIGTSGGRVAVQIPAHALGVAFRCAGTGKLRVVLGGVGFVEGGCDSSVSGNSGFVLTQLTAATAGWRIVTAAGNRWGVAFTRPLLDGGVQEP